MSTDAATDWKVDCSDDESYGFAYSELVIYKLNLSIYWFIKKTIFTVSEMATRSSHNCPTFGELQQWKRLSSADSRMGLPWQEGNQGRNRSGG